MEASIYPHIGTRGAQGKQLSITLRQPWLRDVMLTWHKLTPWKKRYSRVRTHGKVQVQ